MTKLPTTLVDERKLIEHHLKTRDVHPAMAVALGIRADGIGAELEQRENALAVQEHDLDPLDKRFARLAPGHPGA